MRHAKTRTAQQRISRLPEEPPTTDELAAIKKASRELSAGKSVKLKELQRELSYRQQSRAKKSQARSRP